MYDVCIINVTHMISDIDTIQIYCPHNPVIFRNNPSKKNEKVLQKLMVKQVLQTQKK